MYRVSGTVPSTFYLYINRFNPHQLYDIDIEIRKCSVF